MTQDRTLPRWTPFHRGGVAQPRNLADDPADMGTAFGLDLSMLDPALDEPLPDPAPPGQGRCDRRYD